MSTEMKRVLWRSLEHKADPARLEADATGSDVVKRNIEAKDLFTLNRRKFLTLSGAIGTLAGVEGCIRRPAENIMPYADMPEYVNPGVPNHYATVTSVAGEALGLVVTSYEGRPTKVEGNPDHPSSLGATDMWAQSSILDLYDPERSRQPHQKGTPTDFATFDAFFDAKIAELAKQGGAGLYVLAQPTLSPSYVRVRELVMKRLPSARFVTYAPVNQGNVRIGTLMAFGQPLQPIHDFSRAKVVLSLDSDFLGSEPGNVSAQRGYAQARDTTAARGDMNRLYAVEPTMSVTGSNADHRLRLPAQDIGRYLRALVAELGTSGAALGQLSAAVSGAKTDGIPAQWL
ncbi:MAG TPA: oxidoreductase, partial [Polyangiales bacterium]|nr:oxidoreductase [Polyangiales bacterium]